MSGFIVLPRNDTIKEPILSLQYSFWDEVTLCPMSVLPLLPFTSPLPSSVFLLSTTLHQEPHHRDPSPDKGKAEGVSETLRKEKGSSR